MGRSVGDAAAQAVEKSKKKVEFKERSESEIVRDIELNLNAGLSVVPTDIRLLLNRYKESKAKEALNGGIGSIGVGQESQGAEERGISGSVVETEG